MALNGLDPDSAYRYDQYLAAAWKDDKGVQFRPIPDVEKGESKLADALKESDPGKRAEAVKATDALLRVQTGRKDWFGLKNRFFAVLLKPDSTSLEAIESYRHRTPAAATLQKFAEAGLGNKNLAVSAETKELRVSERNIYQFDLFAGPQKEDVLRELPGAQDLQQFGSGCFISPIAAIVNMDAPLILGLLKFTGSLLGNLGVGIIVTTLLIKLFVFPLTLKSQRSMAAMQALGPKIQALRERYGNDQQKFGMEQMKLFREHKVNPMAGCLPMLIQMPVFIGMYSVFEQSVELRGAPFFLWIKDLSQPDHLLGPWVPVEIPLLITTLSIDAFNLLPIVMTLTWFLQAYFQPRSPDPQMASQQKMMMWMPVVFGLMCYGLASGLSLYFLVNSLLGMGEQKLIKGVFLPKPEPSKA
jgi:YidC/Oxa1 family membrane protein insertase